MLPICPIVPIVVKKISAMKPKIQKSASSPTLHISLLLLALCPVSCALAQQTIYVDASNSTGIENGTPEYPFNTILEGLQISQNGDSISIIPGSYAEDSILIEKCVSISGGSPLSTIVEGTFILSSKLDTLPVLIRNLWCRNVMHSDSGATQTPLIISECGLQTLNDYTPSVEETGRILIETCVVEDSIHIESASCAARREVINCETEGGLWVSCSSSRGNIRILDNKVNGSVKVTTISKSDMIFITGNTITDSLVVSSVASDADVITNNYMGKGLRIYAVTHSGFQLTGNQVQDGSLSATFRALSESVIQNNVFLNGGIYFKAVAGDITIKENDIHTDGSVSGISLETKTGGYFENNSIALPYAEPSGLPIEDDTISVCAIHVRSTSFGGMRGNQISGGAYGVYLSAISANEFDLNEIEASHYGLYLRTVSGNVDSNRVEFCTGDGMILDYQPEYNDTNSIILNYNIVRNNGGHGIRTRGNCTMGKLNEPGGTGFNIIKNNGGYDLYVETPYTFVDTIWAQNNEWSHSTTEEVGLYDIFDANDDASKAVVMFKPLAPSGTGEIIAEDFVLYPNPTNGKFQISSFKLQKVDVVDLFGKVVESYNNRTIKQVNYTIIEFEISDLPAGVYFIRISLENQTIVKKIIKI